jgi:hypothetical protein
MLSISVCVACRYDAAQDQLRCWSVPEYGPLHWPLPAMEIAFPLGPERYRWFARTLLEGAVCPRLAAFMVRPNGVVGSVRWRIDTFFFELRLYIACAGEQTDAASAHMDAAKERGTGRRSAGSRPRHACRVGGGLVRPLAHPIPLLAPS